MPYQNNSKSYWLAKINNLQQTIGSVGGGGGGGGGNKTSKTELRFI